MKEALPKFDIGEEIRLSARMGVSAGEVVTMHVGGIHDRCELLLAGSPLGQMSVAEHLAEPGEVVLSPEAWSLVSDRCAGDLRGAGCFRLTATNMGRVLDPPAIDRPTLINGTAILGYLPGAIRSRLLDGQAVSGGRIGLRQGG